MTLKLTPDILRASYNFLCELPPFDRWNLPDAHDIIFRVTRHHDRWAHYRRTASGKPEIVISARFIQRTESLVETMAHEMVHLHQARAGMENAAQHNAAFKKLAARICKIHGFDPGLF